MGGEEPCSAPPSTITSFLSAAAAIKLFVFPRICSSCFMFLLHLLHVFPPLFFSRASFTCMSLSFYGSFVTFCFLQLISLFFLFSRSFLVSFPCFILFLSFLSSTCRSSFSHVLFTSSTPFYLASPPPIPSSFLPTYSSYSFQVSSSSSYSSASPSSTGELFSSLFEVGQCVKATEEGGKKRAVHINLPSDAVIKGATEVFMAASRIPFKTG